MKNSEIYSLQALLRTAGKNVDDASKHLSDVAWPHDTEGLPKSIRQTQLALQQTINTVNAILEDLK